MTTSQADRNIDELLVELKQLKNKNSSLELELRGMNQTQRSVKAELDRERSREFNQTRMGGSVSPLGMSGYFGQTGYSGISGVNGQSSSVIDTIKSKIDSLCKKIGVMAHELGKIYQSLENCTVIISDWRAVGSPEESEPLRNLQARAERAADSQSGVNYQQEISAAKGDASELTLQISRQLQSIVSRLESVDDTIKRELTKKAAELLAVKNEMDVYDPSKRIPRNLRASGVSGMM